MACDIAEYSEEVIEEVEAELNEKLIKIAQEKSENPHWHKARIFCVMNEITGYFPLFDKDRVERIYCRIQKSSFQKAFPEFQFEILFSEYANLEEDDERKDDLFCVIRCKFPKENNFECKDDDFENLCPRKRPRY